MFYLVHNNSTPSSPSTCQSISIRTHLPPTSRHLCVRWLSSSCALWRVDGFCVGHQCPLLDRMNNKYVKEEHKSIAVVTAVATNYPAYLITLQHLKMMKKKNNKAGGLKESEKGKEAQAAKRNSVFL